MMTRLAYAAAVAATALAGSASAQPAATNDGSVVVRDESNLKLTYEWEYFRNSGDPYVLFDVKLENVALSASNDDITGISLGVVSPDVAWQSSKRYTLMQAIRAVQIQIRNEAGAATGTITDLVKNFCSASTTECNNLNGWNQPKRRWQAMVSDSKPGAAFDCSVGDRMSVESVSSSKSGSREDLTVQLKIFPDAFQGCGKSNGDAGKFLFDMTPDAEIGLVYGVWASDSRNTNSFNSPHTHVWLNGDVRFLQLTKPAPQPTSASPSMSPTTSKPTANPTDAPTLRPTPKPTTPIPTKNPTTGKPSKAPTMKPSKAPTSSRPSRSPTTGIPTASPTAFPTRAPVGPIKCPDDEDYVVCSSVNGMYSHLANRPADRQRLVKNMCNSGRFSGRCQFCAAGAESLSGCRPKKDVDGDRFATADLCLAAEDPFPASGCQMFSQCPSADNMAGCRAVNDLELGSNRQKRPVCINAFTAGEHTVEKGACTWCNGRCRAVEPYDFKIGKRVICETPNLFGQLRECEITPGITASDISSKFL